MSTDANNIKKYLKFANVQMAAESLFSLGTVGGTPIQNIVVGSTRTNTDDMTAATLVRGNTRASVFTQPLADQFMQNWKLVEHQTNTTTGFSGTLLRATRTDAILGITQGELVLSFRSTEFADDAVRDNKVTNTLEISQLGFAFGQIADMEAWYADLVARNQIKTDTNGVVEKVAVTGYSLGGHLATAFNRGCPEFCVYRFC